MRGRMQRKSSRPIGWLSLAATVTLAFAGCGSEKPDAGMTAPPAKGGFDPSPPSTGPMPGLPRATKKKAHASSVPPTIPPERLAETQRRSSAPPRSLADLLPADGSVPEPALPGPPLPEIDDAAVNQLGIRKIVGTHVVLYTDLPADPQVDELPAVFDRAVPLWAEYFSIPPEQVKSWKVVGYLMQDKERFRRVRLLPDTLPEFLHGYQRGGELWLYEQPSPYYRRHLLLHEGTHAFMHWRLGGAGPPWYMEGMAELLATHRWRDGQLVLRYFPADRQEVPEWGRVKIVRDGYRANRALTIMDVLNYDARAHLQLEPYGWCWALCAFLDGHPVFQQRFRNLRRYTRDTGKPFSDRLIGWFRDDGQRLWREWQWYVMNMDYGYDVAAEAFQYRPVAELPATGATVTIATNRGWQSTGFQLSAGRKVRLTATGRYLLRTEPKPWPCEPNGVTIEYYLGQPLGIVLAAVVDESDPEAPDNGFLKPLPIGLGRGLTPEINGTLFLRINDFPSQVADNEGTVEIRLQAE